MGGSASEHRIRTGRLHNVLHSLVLVGGMLGLLCAIGALLAGVGGLLLLGILGLLVFLLSPRISPRWVLRLYRAQPLSPQQAPFLTELIAWIAGRAGLPTVPRVYYVPSAMVNAFAVGTRSDAAIGVTDGILRNLDRRELAGVLAHEISHVRSNDIWVMSLADLVARTTNALSFLGQFLLLLNLPLLLLGRFTVPWAAVFLLILAPTISALLQLALSRTREYDADLSAARLTGDPRGLASALVKLDRLNAGFFERIFMPGRRLPDPSLLRTHPHTEDRIRRLLALEEEPGRGPEAPLEDSAAAWASPVPPRVARGPRWHASGLWY